MSWIGDKIETGLKSFHGDDWATVVQEAEARRDVIQVDKDDYSFSDVGKGFKDAWSGFTDTVSGFFGGNKPEDKPNQTEKRHEPGENNGGQVSGADKGVGRNDVPDSF